MKTGVQHAGWPQWAVVAIVVALVIPVVTILVLQREVDLFILRWFELPGFEKTLGFKSGHVSLPPESGFDRPIFVIIDVSPDSAFEKAGIRAGDIPRGYHGGEAEFLWSLALGKSRGTARLRVTPGMEASKGHWQVEREVTVTFPTGSHVPPA